MNILTLDELFQLQLSILYNVENQLVEAIPLMIENATNDELKKTLQNHLNITKGQVKRLEKVAKAIDFDLKEKEDKGLKSLLTQEQDLLRSIDDETVKDTAIMGGTAKVEHYEMSFYKGTKIIAKKLGLDEVAGLLDESLEEEKEAAKMIEAMAEGGLLIKAIHAVT